MEAAANQRGAQSAGRWGSRALLVLGGVLAGTAAAWAFATGAASAETVTEPADATATADLTPVTDATVAGLNDLTAGAADLAGDTTGALAHAWNTAGEQAAEVPQGSPRVIDQEVADAVSAGVTGFANDAVVNPVGRTLGSFEHIVRKPEDAPRVIEETLTPPKEFEELGRKVIEFLRPKAADAVLENLPQLSLDEIAAGETTAPVELVPAAAAAPITVLLPVDISGVESADNKLPSNGSAPGDESSERELPSPFSPLRAPMAPLSFPTVPGGGNTSGGHFDGLLGGMLAGPAAAFDTANIGSVRCGVRHLTVEPGAQPGVTPD